MDIWSTYRNHIDIAGSTQRGAAYEREVRNIYNKLQHNLSYQEVTIDGAKHNLAVINTDNLNEKNIISLPKESFKDGGIVHWLDNYWLITEKDANNTIYTKGKMIQCNHLLKWVSDDKRIIEQWCVVEDGTKYLTGENEDRDFVVTRGDSRIAVTVPRNENTLSLNRGSRFLVDDTDCNPKLAYMLTKPLKMGLTYNNEGVFKFVFQEVTATDDDNHELGIADYYKYFPRESNDDIDTDVSTKKRWL